MEEREQQLSRKLADATDAAKKNDIEDQLKTVREQLQTARKTLLEADLAFAKLGS